MSYIVVVHSNQIPYKDFHFIQLPCVDLFYILEITGMKQTTNLLEILPIIYSAVLKSYNHLPFFFFRN